MNRAQGPENGASDWSLLERVVRKDESALAALYDRYSGLVYAESIRILRDAGAAEEILQDLFLQVWRTAEKFDPQRGSLPGWLLVAARHRCISRLRRRDSRANDELTETSVVLPCNLESAAAQNQLLGRVKKALGGLPNGQREAIELAYFEGMSHSEIAGRTGAPLGTIKTWIRTAMDTLKRELA
ncbi:MAG TPA: sigma-70 family RNA polymerase sigma factor [Candidatus Acidoferrales bacterium]|nr:sigma-70 family RNA polymerase sigma factor [Candidatus Acidoferrales bacterium]